MKPELTAPPLPKSGYVAGRIVDGVRELVGYDICTDTWIGQWATIIDGRKRVAMRELDPSGCADPLQAMDRVRDDVMQELVHG